MIDSLLRQAVGAEPPRFEQWQSLQAPATDLLAPIACRSVLSQEQPRARGLKRYMWARYQKVLREAKAVFDLAPDDLLLIDDLHLAWAHYETPIARVIHRIDFFARREARPRLEQELQARAWQKCENSPEHVFSDFTQPDGESLRLHWQWMDSWPVGDDELFGRALRLEPFRTPSSLDQLSRICWQGLDHLWLLDAQAILLKCPELGPRFPAQWGALTRRWDAIAQKRLGMALGLSQATPAPRNLAQCLLGWTHRRPGLYSETLAKMAISLVRQGLSGWPQEWLAELRRLWALESSSQIPAAFLERWRSPNR